MDFLLKCKRDKEFIELPRVVLLFLETLYPLISAPFSIMFANGIKEVKDIMVFRVKDLVNSETSKI